MQLNIDRKAVLQHMSSFSLGCVRKWRAVLHLCRPWGDFADRKLLSVEPPSSIDGKLDIKLLAQRWRINMTSYKYNYGVSSLVPLALVTFFYMRILIAAFFSILFYTFVLNIDKLAQLQGGEPVKKILKLVYSNDGNGQLKITPFHKNVTSGILSMLTFFVFGALTPIVLISTLSFLLSSVHALLRCKPPALGGYSTAGSDEVTEAVNTAPRSDAEARKATSSAREQEEGEIIEDEVNENIRMRGNRGTPGAVPGQIRKKAE